MNLTLLKYLKSFSDGRIRIRHPALSNAKLTPLVQEALLSTHGVRDAQVNPRTGSLLILYDSTILSREELITMGTAWAKCLDDVQKGLPLTVPVFS